MAAEIGRLVKRIEEVPREAMFEVIDRFSEVATREANSDRMPFRNRGAGPKAEVDTVTYRDDEVTVLMYGTPAGPWSWLENGVPTHMVGLARSFRLAGNMNYRAATSTPDGPRAFSSASFPQRGTWTRTVDLFDSNEFADIVSAEVARAIA